MRTWLIAASILFGLAFVFTFWKAFAAESQASLALTQSGVAGPPHRESNSPDISFIDSTSPTCSLAVPGTGVCYINWNYMYVTASTSQYIISMTLTIDGELQSYNSGFFQTAMYIPGTLYSPGFRVNCGLPGTHPTGVGKNLPVHHPGA